LTALQKVFCADRRWALLIVLQGLDGAGKDGTVGHVMSAFSPQGAAVTAFKVPTDEERAHDFLWRIHPHAPPKGAIAIFNRSHYEDFLVPCVHRRLDHEACRERLRDIRAFEKLLAHSETHILKFFLHISKREQLARFEHRLDDPSRNWKISESDYVERAHWDEYIEAYDEMLCATSRAGAPWFVIPADHKWFRDLAVSQIVAHTIEDLHPIYPKPTVDLDEIRRKYHAAADER
jgi:PPK2 family polyphosphate:nucleotide phosphotransferase